MALLTGPLRLIFDPHRGQNVAGKPSQKLRNGVAGGVFFLHQIEQFGGCSDPLGLVLGSITIFVGWIAYPSANVTASADASLQAALT